MPTFTFNARDNRGQWHKGTLVAESPAALAGALRGRGLSLVNAKHASDPASTPSKRRRGILPPASLDVELGLRMIANMLDGGLTLMSALKTCADQSRRARMARVWDDVHDRIAGGMSFAEALVRHRKCFPKLVIQLTRAGELSGNLEVVLEQAADQLERKLNLMTTLFSGMMYPVFATIVSVVVTAYLMVSVIPELAKFLTADNRKLPAMTLALMATSNFITTYFWQITIVTVAAVAGLVIAHKWKPAALVIDACVLRIPIVGKLFRLAGTSMFARGLAMMMEAGVPLLTALETAGGLMKNQAIVHRVETSRQAVMGGNTLARPLAAGREFLPMLPRMVAVGEETGTLSSVLVKVANFHEKQLEAYVKRLTILIEPVMTVVVGTIVGFVYLAFFMALYSIVGSRGN
jgi:type II secretory pathway component PulF